MTMIPNPAVVWDARRAQRFAEEDQQFCGTVINGDKPSVRKHAILRVSWAVRATLRACRLLALTARLLRCSDSGG